MHTNHEKRYSVLVTSNPLNHEGGVVAFYSVLLKSLGEFECDVRHHTLGSRMEHFYSPVRKRLFYPVFYCWDLLRLCVLLLGDRGIRIVQVNPSLIPVPLLRDGPVILIAKFLRRDVVVLFHGWKDYVLDYLKKHAWARWLFRLVYRRADLTLVLSSGFREDLLALGWDPSAVEVTTTMYEAETVLPSVDRSGQRPRFLFLGRISQLKGIDELIEAARILRERGNDFEFVMVGHGDREGMVEEYKQRVEQYGLASRFRFTGRLTGEEKHRVYAECDVYVFPSGTEGCPTSVLVALGSGLFVISTDVGALKDIIREGENGRIARLKDPEHLADLMGWAGEHIEDIRGRRSAIRRDAEDRYEVAVVCRQFKEIYRDLIDGK